MWGPSIVGYGSYTYRYESGRSGEACLTGFAVRGKELVVYLVAESPEQVALLAKLGKHKIGKSCLYFKRLADLDAKILEALIARDREGVRTAMQTHFSRMGETRTDGDVSSMLLRDSETAQALLRDLLTA